MKTVKDKFSSYLSPLMAYITDLPHIDNYPLDEIAPRIDIVVMRITSIIIVCLILLTASFASAAENDSYFRDYIVSYPHTVGKAISAPLNWETSDWLKAGGVIAICGSLYLLDEEIRDFIQDNRTDSGDNILTGFKQFGEGKYMIPAMGATILAGCLTGSEKTTDTGLLCLKSFILAESVTQGLKIATQRQRPDKENGNQFWNNSSFIINNNAFPSGHATLVWSLAPILAHQYRNMGWVPPVAYSIAALTSYSRLNDDKHWASDVFFGAVIGYVSAKLVLADTPVLTLAPDIEHQGLAFQFEF